MARENSCCRACCRGLYACQWRSSHENKSKACCWYIVVTLVSLLSLCWMYICLVIYNDQDDVNWKVFTILKQWVNWSMVLIITYAVLTSYCILLLLFALFHAALGEQLNLHWLHKIFLCLGGTLTVTGIVVLSYIRREQWSAVRLSLEATAPFLQFGAVGALTLLSSFVFHCFHRVKCAGSKVLIAVVFVAVSAAIFLCPIFIRSPCLIEWSELPDKPKLIGHRGAPMLAPENTMMSFNRSIACGVTAFETDVQLSNDSIPFLMHDNESDFLLRTTNVKEKFPRTNFNNSTSLTWEVLQSLNAGEWFLKTDPFNSVSQLSEEEKETARKQTIPSLYQLLILAKQHSISVIFDLYSPNPERDAKDTVKAILDSKIDPSLILWLPPVNMTDQGFIQVYKSTTEMRKHGENHLNAKYSELTTDEIRELRRDNVTVNLWVVNERWLFSLLWCAGASSVTTNSCHLLKEVDRPDWTLSHLQYKIIWISVDLVSFLIMIGLYIFQRKKHSLCPRRGTEQQRSNTSASNEKDVPLLSFTA
ncbi:glycerophosphoinositol inositolphosphodiesterase GDPD2 isoform X3 [Toxotes jaculatrix]|uniref:glycerophosphoinositol inositolphosphodiesterase GDPD2 isoform X3 n=1 Tax=Toxotes jaculatrix TaxID=941984 RepID=UPI001B3A84A4|nr:glycerophosphoinositol inositolphosphodiesterase GDPD2 isoform X3 [Toxotes jaculatrix]